MLKTIDINGNPHIGIFCRANDEYAIVSPDVPNRIIKTIEKILNVTTIKTTICGTSLIGPLTLMNSRGVIVPEYITDRELKILENILNVSIISDKLNAVGNNVIVNDTAGLVHPMLSSKTIHTIEKSLSVSVIKYEIAGMRTVGSICVATNKGFLCHPKIKDKEIKTIEKQFKLHPSPCTVNYGSALLGIGIVANTNGALVGKQSTGIELGRIEEGLGFLD